MLANSIWCWKSGGKVLKKSISNSQSAMEWGKMRNFALVYENRGTAIRGNDDNSNADADISVADSPAREPHGESRPLADGRGHGAAVRPVFRAVQVWLPRHGGTTRRLRCTAASVTAPISKPCSRRGKA